VVSLERVHIDMYVLRYGDPAGIAARVLGNLLDLLPITKNSVILPLPSYSLKVVEQYVGFERTQDEYGGSWAMAQFILATETNDESEWEVDFSSAMRWIKRRAFMRTYPDGCTHSWLFHGISKESTGVSGHVSRSDQYCRWDTL